MNRRRFLLHSGLVAGGLMAGMPTAPAHAPSPRIRWKRAGNSGLFHAATLDGADVVHTRAAGLLDAQCRLWSESPAQTTRLQPGAASATHGPLRVRLTHELRQSGSPSGEDCLEATLTITNTSNEPHQVAANFVSAAQPPVAGSDALLHVPLNVAGFAHDKRFVPLGMEEFLGDCRQTVGNAAFTCHYLEPRAAHPDELTTRALLLVPVLDFATTGTPWHVALFTASDDPMRFTTSARDGVRSTEAGRVVTIPAGDTVALRAWLLLHTGDPATAWRAFHRFGHDHLHRRIVWPSEFKVHYYDFLSSANGRGGRRGDGYDADAKHFHEFRVGLATQHGYYPCMGDHLHPDRTEWLAMQGDKPGPTKMSFTKIRERLQAARAAGAKAGIYMHLSALDDSSREFYPALAGGRRIDNEGRPVPFAWNGPDVKGKLWWMSMSSPEWRAHLLQQAEWIMDILQPDAICMDETFSGMGYNYAGGGPEPLSPHAIGFFKELHALIRSFGDDKAFFSSDCSRSAFCFWADGEVGDHAYSGSLGNPLYTQEPVRYLAALGDKPWRPCAWHWQGMWNEQMQLARQVGAGVGVSNGWAEFTGLTGLDADARQRTLADIARLFEDHADMK